MTTNYERIKNMNLDEMAQMLRYMSTCFDSCGVCPIRESCPNYLSDTYIRVAHCREVWKQWLKRESENEPWLKVGYDE